MRRLRSFAVTSIAAVALTACGGGAAEPGVTLNGFDLLGALDATQQFEQVDMVMTIEMNTFGQSFEFSGVGVGGLTPGASMQMSMEFDADMIAALGPGFDGPNEMRMVDGVMYQRGALLNQAHLPRMGDATWSALPTPEVLTAMNSSSGQDAGSMIEMLRLAGSDIETLDDAQIDGVEVSHVRAVVNMGATYDAQGVDMKDFMRAQGEMTGQVVPEAMLDGLIEGMRSVDMTYDAWFNADGTMRRMETTSDLSPGMGMDAGAMTMVMTMDLTNYRATPDVEIFAPDPADTFVLG